MEAKQPSISLRCGNPPTTQSRTFVRCAASVKVGSLLPFDRPQHDQTTDARSTLLTAHSRRSLTCGVAAVAARFAVIRCERETKLGLGSDVQMALTVEWCSLCWHKPDVHQKHLARSSLLSFCDQLLGNTSNFVHAG